MAVAIYYDGPARLYLGAGVSSIQELGYTADGVNVTQEPYYLPVPCDLFGGESGPPIDTQALGITATIRLDLTRFEYTVFEAIKKIVSGGTIGSFTTPGKLMVQEAAYWRVLINTPARPYNFPICVVNPIEDNKSVKYKRPFVTFTALMNPSTGLLFDAVTT